MTSEPLIRPTQPEDIPALIDLTRATRMFKPLEIVTLAEVFDDYFSGTCGQGHHGRTLWRSAEPVGFVYFAPAPMTDGTWYLYWIVVAAEEQGQGFGSMLLRRVETEVRQLGGRVLFIETSGLPHYEKTRQFYLRHGFEHEATLRDFYAAGDDMIVFRKALR